MEVEGKVRPKSIFQLDYFPGNKTREWLNVIPFDKIGVLHLPSYSVVYSGSNKGTGT